MNAFATGGIDVWWAPVWERYRASYAQAAPALPAAEAALRREHVFCLLGGHGVTFELALSAKDAIIGLRPFDEDWTASRLRAAIERELHEAQYEPRRADGTLRRYRFPGRKARLIAQAVEWVAMQGGLRSGLAARACERDRRTWLCECPGIGLKTASWMLRNCGWAERLAILDVHLIRALKEANVVAGTRLPRDYERIEAAYLAWADRLGACPSSLDVFLWDVQRARSTATQIRSRRERRPKDAATRESGGEATSSASRGGTSVSAGLP